MIRGASEMDAFVNTGQLPITNPPHGFSKADLFVKVAGVRACWERSGKISAFTMKPPSGRVIIS